MLIYFFELLGGYKINRSVRIAETTTEFRISSEGWKYLPLDLNEVCRVEKLFIACMEDRLDEKVLKYKVEIVKGFV